MLSLCVALQSKAEMRIMHYSLRARLSPGYTVLLVTIMKNLFVKYLTSKGNLTGSIKAVKFYYCYYGKSPPWREFMGIVMKHRVCTGLHAKTHSIFAARGRIS